MFVNICIYTVNYLYVYMYTYTHVVYVCVCVLFTGFTGFFSTMLKGIAEHEFHFFLSDCMNSDRASNAFLF